MTARAALVLSAVVFATACTDTEEAFEAYCADRSWSNPAALEVDCGDDAPCCPDWRCASGKCALEVCYPDRQRCFRDQYCCSGQCLGGECRPAGECREAGGACGDSTDCCGALDCVGNVCTGPSGGGGTLLTGFACLHDGDCVSIQCLGAGTPGRQCGDRPGVCNNLNQQCADHNDCCGALRCHDGWCTVAVAAPAEVTRCYASGVSCRGGDRCCSGTCNEQDHRCP